MKAVLVQRGRAEGEGPGGRRSDLEGFDCVRDWLLSVAARGTGSPQTREVYLDRLHYFLKFSRLDPVRLIDLAKSNPARVKRLLNSMVVEWEKKGRSRQHTSSTFRTVMAFLKENEVLLNVRSPKVFPSGKRRTLKIDEVRRSMKFCRSLRLRAFVACMKDCGMAPVDILKLRYGDVRKELEAGRVPVKVSILRNKTRVEFESFLGPDAVEYLGYYLDARRTGTDKIPPEKIGDRSFLFALEGGDQLTYDALKSQHWRESKIAKVEWQIYDLRRFFSTNMKAAGVNDTLVEYWMGHKLPSSIDGYFFSPENQEQIYMGAYPRISLKEERSPEDLRRQQLLDTARMLSFSPELIEKIKEDIHAGQTIEEATERLGRSLDERVREVAERFLALPEGRRESVRGSAMEKARAGGEKEKVVQDMVVPKKDLQKYLRRGWTFVSALDGDVIVRRSS